MKMWVVTMHEAGDYYPYPEPVGVYSTEEKAKAAVLQDQEKDVKDTVERRQKLGCPPLENPKPSMTYDITELELDAEVDSG
jgi:hypothetical protein